MLIPTSVNFILLLSLQINVVSVCVYIHAFFKASCSPCSHLLTWVIRLDSFQLPFRYIPCTWKKVLPKCMYHTHARSHSLAHTSLHSFRNVLGLVGNSKLLFFWVQTIVSFFFWILHELSQWINEFPGGRQGQPHVLFSHLLFLRYCRCQRP